MTPKQLCQYMISFNHDDGIRSEFAGFSQEIPGGYSFGEGGYHHTLIFHDIFEHWFENTGVFTSPGGLSINGEAFAMGIREYLYRNTHLINKWATYNKYKGLEWNTWQEIYGLISDPKYDRDGNEYEVCLRPNIHPELIDIDNNLIGYELAKKYCISDSHRVLAAIGRSFGAGFTWAMKFLGREQYQAIDAFMENWMVFSRFFQLGSGNHYEKSTFNFTKMDVKVDLWNCHIVATVHGYDLNGNGSQCFISNRMSEDQQLKNISRLIGEPSRKYECYFSTI